MLEETEIILAVPLPSALATCRCRPEERHVDGHVDGRVLFRVREIWRLLMMIVAAKRRETYDIARRTSLMKWATSIATHRSQYPIFAMCHKKSRSYSHTNKLSGVLHHAYASCFAGKCLTAVGSITDACVLCEENSNSPEARDMKVDCICNAGFTGPNGEFVHNARQEYTK